MFLAVWKVSLANLCASPEHQSSMTFDELTVVTEVGKAAHGGTVVRIAEDIVLVIVEGAFPDEKTTAVVADGMGWVAS